MPARLSVSLRFAVEASNPESIAKASAWVSRRTEHIAEIGYRSTRITGRTATAPDAAGPRDTTPTRTSSNPAARA